jgi:hypothetical protein
MVELQNAFPIESVQGWRRWFLRWEVEEGAGFEQLTLEKIKTPTLKNKKQ